MSNKKTFRPRITIDVDQELYERYYKGLPWGVRNNFLRAVLEQSITAVEAHGLAVVYLIQEGKLNIFGSGVKRKESLHG